MKKVGPPNKIIHLSLFIVIFIFLICTKFRKIKSLCLDLFILYLITYSYNINTYISYTLCALYLAIKFKKLNMIELFQTEESRVEQEE